MATLDMEIKRSRLTIIHFYYSKTLNNEYIGRIYQMSSWNFSMGFILYYVNFSICENIINSHEYAGTVLKSSI